MPIWKRGKRANLPLIEDGNAYVATDTHDLYFDLDGNRIRIGDIVSILTLVDLENITDVIEDKIYFVQETLKLYKKVDGKWKAISGSDGVKYAKDLITDENNRFVSDTEIQEHDKMYDDLYRTYKEEIVWENFFTEQGSWSNLIFSEKGITLIADSATNGLRRLENNNWSTIEIFGENSIYRVEKCNLYNQNNDVVSNYFIAVSNNTGTNKVYTSFDGVNWILLTSSGADVQNLTDFKFNKIDCSAIAYNINENIGKEKNLSLFYAVSSVGAKRLMVCSNSFVNLAPTISQHEWIDIAGYSTETIDAETGLSRFAPKGMFVASNPTNEYGIVTIGENNVATVKILTFPKAYSCNAIETNLEGTIFVILTNRVILFSSDGIRWTEVAAPGTGNWTEVIKSYDYFYIFSDSLEIARSTNGKIWELLSQSLPLGGYKDIIYDNDKLYCVYQDKIISLQVENIAEEKGLVERVEDMELLTSQMIYFTDVVPVKVMKDNASRIAINPPIPNLDANNVQDALELLTESVMGAAQLLGDTGDI